MNTITKSLIAGVLSLTAVSANAVVIDFAAIANGFGGNAEYGVADATYKVGTSANGSTVWDLGMIDSDLAGIELAIYGMDQSGSFQSQYEGYLDSGSYNGLGVCKGVSGTPTAQKRDNECLVNGSFDDNVTVNENLGLIFLTNTTYDANNVLTSWDYAVRNYTFAFNGNHAAIDENDTLQFFAGNGGFGATSATTFGALQAGPLTGSSFIFGYDTNGLSASEFYLGSVVVPEPGPLALLGLGLIGLYAAGRKKAA